MEAKTPRLPAAHAITQELQKLKGVAGESRMEPVKDPIMTVSKRVLGANAFPILPSPFGTAVEEESISGFDSDEAFPRNSCLSLKIMARESRRTVEVLLLAMLQKTS
ncbi:hypothetical protein SAY87_013785 [Trapa incisa]|uniref:Uncharacterized protein n=2 Tax=Trapa TaxID=22665 RepID=A0AAN7QC88_TRANT|nr:hypothetical protein SAY86_009106 [Trapa natans]KAK4764347.1 hypothetical protein SAY87_013785 [Trapa incisa]